MKKVKRIREIKSKVKIVGEVRGGADEEIRKITSSEIVVPERETSGGARAGLPVGGNVEEERVVSPSQPASAGTESDEGVARFYITGGSAGGEVHDDYPGASEQRRFVNMLGSQQGGLRQRPVIENPETAGFRQREVEEGETKYQEIKESGPGERKRRYPWQA